MAEKIIVYDWLNNPPKARGEKNSGELIVEIAGYVPFNVQIEQAMQAGLRLQMAHMDEFDVDSAEVDPDTIEIDPTRSPNFDLADITEIKMKLEQKLKESKLKEAEERKKAGLKLSDDLKRLAEFEAKEKERASKEKLEGFAE